MKIATLIARILLGLMFLVFGLNPFLHFLPAVLPSGLAGQFLNVLLQSHYVLFIGAVQVAGGVLLLVNRYVPLALTLLGPVSDLMERRGKGASYLLAMYCSLAIMRRSR
jgi:putative oxidoreductase